MKNGNNGYEVSVIIPFYNNESTIIDALKSFYKQKDFFNELILINDGSLDQSLNLAKSFLKVKNIPYQIINHKKPLGVGYSFNEGIKLSKGELVVLTLPDVIIKKNAFKYLLKPFEKDKKVVLTYHRSILTLQQWKKYNFWMKCLFSRYVHKDNSGMNLQFDCFRKTTLLEVGLFDYNTFKSAGEDMDLIKKLLKKGKFVATEATVEHIHSLDPKFSCLKIIRKTAQQAESHGVILRKYGVKNIINFTKTHFRILLVIGLLIPYVQIISFVLIVIYAILYTKNVYIYEYNNPRIILLPFVNILLLFINTIFTIKAFLAGKQKFS